MDNEQEDKKALKESGYNFSGLSFQEQMLYYKISKTIRERRSRERERKFNLRAEPGD